MQQLLLSFAFRFCFQLVPTEMAGQAVRSLWPWRAESTQWLLQNRFGPVDWESQRTTSIVSWHCKVIGSQLSGKVIA